MIINPLFEFITLKDGSIRKIAHASKIPPYWTGEYDVLTEDDTIHIARKYPCGFVENHI